MAVPRAKTADLYEHLAAWESLYEEAGRTPPEALSLAASTALRCGYETDPEFRPSRRDVRDDLAGLEPDDVMGGDDVYECLRMARS